MAIPAHTCTDCEVQAHNTSQSQWGDGRAWKQSQEEGCQRRQEASGPRRESPSIQQTLQPGLEGAPRVSVAFSVALSYFFWLY